METITLGDAGIRQECLHASLDENVVSSTEAHADILRIPSHEESPLLAEAMSLLRSQQPHIVQHIVEYLKQRNEGFYPMCSTEIISICPPSPVTGNSSVSPQRSPVPPLQPNELVVPQPRDLDVSDPASIETSLTAIHRSIDKGFELARHCNSWSSTSTEDLGEGSPPLSPQMLTRSLSSVILHRRLVFRAKKEEFYPETDKAPLVIVTVGLPARGKSYVSRRICRYMGWKGVPCRIFNAGNYRRQILGADQSADFFSSTNEGAKQMREKMAEMAAEDLVNYIQSGGQVGIFDATNTTRARRERVLKIFTKELNLPFNRVIFLEMVCNDKSLVEHTILNVKLKGKDYEGVDAKVAFEDFKKREAEYVKVYETLELNNESDRKLSFMQLVDAGQAMVTNRIVGALPKSLAQFAGFLKPFAGHLYITCTGDTPDTLAGRLGVDSGLAPVGQDQATKLERWADTLGHDSMHVWCAPTRAGRQTAEPFLRKRKYHVQAWRALMDMDYGKFQGMTYAELKYGHPEVWEELTQDEYFYTWPGGESPCDVVQRLEPILFAMEGKTAPILIICSHTVCRAILSYCRDFLPEQFTRIKLAKNAIFDVDMNAEPVCIETHFL